MTDNGENTGQYSLIIQPCYIIKYCKTHQKLVLQTYLTYLPSLKIIGVIHVQIISKLFVNCILV